MSHCVHSNTHMCSPSFLFDFFNSEVGISAGKDGRTVAADAKTLYVSFALFSGLVIQSSPVWHQSCHDRQWCLSKHWYSRCKLSRLATILRCIRSSGRQPCGLNTPHVHPRATEFNLAVNGTLATGDFEENDEEFIMQTLKPGQATVFPQGYFDLLQPIAL